MHKNSLQKEIMTYFIKSEWEVPVWCAASQLKGGFPKLSVYSSNQGHSTDGCNGYSHVNSQLPKTVSTLYN